MKRENRGFTLIELVTALSIMMILMGMAVPNLDVIGGIRAQKAAQSVTAALDKTRMEAMNRLVGEMELSRRADGYYITYYLDRGRKAAGISGESGERIAPKKVRMSYTDKAGVHELNEGASLILTFDRESGSFLPIQSQVMTQESINEYLAAGTDIPFEGGNNYCTEIRVWGGRRSYVITLIPATGKYEMQKG